MKDTDNILVSMFLIGIGFLCLAASPVLSITLGGIVLVLLGMMGIFTEEEE